MRKIIIILLLICGLVNVFLAKLTLAFWQTGMLSHQLKFTTGDWTPPTISVELSQVDKNYLIDELVGSDCQLEGELELDKVGFECQLSLKEGADLPRWLSFKYQVGTSSGLLPLQPSFVVEVQTPSSTKTVFTDGVSLTDSNDDWRYGWLSLDELAQFANDQGQISLIFRTLPSQVSGFNIIPTQVKLKELTTLRFAVSTTDKLRLLADEPVIWQINYQVGDEARQLKEEGKEVELGFDGFEVNTLPSSWQISAIDQAGNQSQILKPQLYILDEGKSQVNVINLEHNLESDNRLSLKFDLLETWLDQTLGFRLRQKDSNNWQEVDLFKVVPFNQPIFMTSVKNEKVVLTTVKPVNLPSFCLDALSLVGSWKEVLCTD